jgi:hypothetical protein
MKRQLRLERLNAIGREHQIAQLAAQHFQELLRRNPALLYGEQLRPADAKRFHHRLGDTYLLRLFAEFEEGLRDWWRNGLGRRGQIRTHQLVDNVAARRLIPKDDLDNVHAVRNYRNSLIHEEDEEIDPVEFFRAKSSLCKYFSRLPETW